MIECNNDFLFPVIKAMERGGEYEYAVDFSRVLSYEYNCR